MHASGACREARHGRARVLRHHGATPIEAEDHRALRGRGGARHAAAEGDGDAADGASPRHALLGGAEVARLGSDAGRIEAGQLRKGRLDLPDRHPAHPLTDVDQSLPCRRIVQQVGPAAEELFAQLIHAKAAVVQRRRPLNALLQLQLVPAEDRGNHLDAAGPRQRRAELRGEGGVVVGAQDGAELPAAVLAGGAAQELRPLPRRRGHECGDQQQPALLVHVGVVDAVVCASAAPRVRDRHPPGLGGAFAVAQRERRAVQVVLPLHWIRLAERPRQRPHDVLGGGAQSAQSGSVAQVGEHFLDVAAVSSDHQHWDPLPCGQGDLRDPAQLLLRRGLDVDGLPQRAHPHREGLVEGAAAAGRQERRDLKERSPVRPLDEIPLRPAADGACDADDPVVLLEDARPGHDEEALLELDMFAHAVLEVAALQRQGPDVGVRAAGLESAVPLGLLREDEIPVRLQRLALLPLARHFRDHPLRRGMGVGLDRLDRGMVSPGHGLRHSRRHPAQLGIGVHERLVGLLVDDQSIDLVHNQHLFGVAAEVAPPSGDPGVVGLHMLGLAVAYVGVRIDSGHDASLLVLVGGQALFRRAQDSGDVALLARLVRCVDLEDVEEALEIPEVALEQGLVVDDDVGLLAKGHDDVDGECGNDHGLPFAGADLREQRMRRLLRGVHLQEALEGQQADHLGVVRESEHVELLLHRQSPVVEDVPEVPQRVVRPSQRGGPNLLEDGLDVVQVVVLRDADQLGAGDVALRRIGEAVRRGGVQRVRLLLEFLVGEHDALTLGVLEEKQHCFQVLQERPEFLGVRLLALHEGQRPVEEQFAGVAAAVHQPQADVEVREVEGPQVRASDDALDNQPLDRVGMEHRALLPREQDLAHTLRCLRAAPAQVHFRQLRVFEGAEELVATPGQLRVRCGQVLDLPQNFLERHLDTLPRLQPLSGQVHDRLDDRTAIAVHPDGLVPLGELPVERAHVTALHGELQRRQVVEDALDLLRLLLVGGQLQRGRPELADQVKVSLVLHLNGQAPLVLGFGLELCLARGELRLVLLEPSLELPVLLADLALEVAGELSLQLGLLGRELRRLLRDQPLVLLVLLLDKALQVMRHLGLALRQKLFLFCHPNLPTLLELLRLLGELPLPRLQLFLLRLHEALVLLQELLRELCLLLLCLPAGLGLQLQRAALGCHRLILVGFPSGLPFQLHGAALQRDGLDGLDDVCADHRSALHLFDALVRAPVHAFIRKARAHYPGAGRR
mmetsp:Transcript_51808/g.150669  ORF Transcript_51808/g.150669 Transcript_51808/m.150669 type:complete len:1245 (-) Transcript_51808:152-3886(-)